ncbi:N-acetyltransferase [Nocardioides mangrovicus]|uniref:N-acetyltransferase n=1 Tax=Nocardioides mangrovicus TaxID=2478913 RepID=A0A3L8P7I3_9ACTN|nr:GNAT family protein [Nocardioides mangrovicus]RLV51104.1 N-acetyltransferase [Nocardioides mangrovicus]
MPINDHGQPVGEPVPDWSPRPVVAPVRLVGRTVRVEPLAEEHVADLWQALCVESPPSTWTYLPWGPYSDAAGVRGYVATLLDDPGWVPHVLVVEGRAQGVACYLRNDAPNGVVEVGGIGYGAALQRTVAATEAMYLMARHVFDELGYRRYEWKCDSLNEPSRRAATRLGFGYEGRFRQALVYKGRNRDTDWFAMTDGDWPALRAAYESWLDPGNFDDGGRQRAPLACRTASPDPGTGVTLS